MNEVIGIESVREKVIKSNTHSQPNKAEEGTDILQRLSLETRFIPFFRWRTEVLVTTCCRRREAKPIYQKGQKKKHRLADLCLLVLKDLSANSLVVWMEQIIGVLVDAIAVAWWVFQFPHGEDLGIAQFLLLLRHSQKKSHDLAINSPYECTEDTISKLSRETLNNGLVDSLVILPIKL